MIKRSIEELLDVLKMAQEEKDYENVAKHYLQLGKDYKKEGRTAKAIYYLNRFDNLVGGDDSLYEKFEKKDNKAMEWIETLEEEYEPYEKMIQGQVVEKASDLNVLQKMQWLVLTMSRFCKLFQLISALPDFEVFGKLDEIVSYFCEGLYGELNEDIENEISEFDELTDEVFDSILMSDYTKKVDLPNQESFVPADLESGEGTFYFGAAVHVLQYYLFDELDEDDIEMEFAACGILADYFYRTSDTEVKDEQKIKEETERIFSDYDFVKTGPDAESFRERVEEYKKVMLV